MHVNYSFFVGSKIDRLSKTDEFNVPIIESNVKYLNARKLLKICETPLLVTFETNVHSTNKQKNTITNSNA